jgi:hypothetical protein
MWSSGQGFRAVWATAHAVDLAAALARQLDGIASR